MTAVLPHVNELHHVSRHSWLSRVHTAVHIDVAPCSGRVKRIIAMCGAGISVSAGIPDFRTPGTGLYSQGVRFTADAHLTCHHSISVYSLLRAPLRLALVDILEQDTCVAAKRALWHLAGRHATYIWAVAPPAIPAKQ
eukprot:GHUV01022864.1.p2 GENE.GHUV01022864.1~~GHUV01022864.1.p2  ORF type:complete len:138 (+),score=7.83 GHUV01022864.1:330-743(+)